MEATHPLKIEKPAPRPFRIPAVQMPIPEAFGPDSARAALLAEHHCLTEAIYYEARGEGEEGEKAVAEVIFHRVQRGDTGKSICAVVSAGADRGQCQFTFMCDGAMLKPRSKEEWRQAEILAARMLTGAENLGDATRGATNYHAVEVHPVWSTELVRTAQIGNHIFYRTLPETENVAFRGSIW